jgi:glycosyltransferase involved in cell wall biosynthesis
MRVVIVLPPGSRFDARRPTSIETVVRSLGAHSRDRDALTVICDEGGERGDALSTLAIAPQRSPGRRARVIADHVARLQPDLVEVHQHMPSAAALAKRLRALPVILYRHNLLPRAGDPLKQWRHRRRAALFDGHLFVSEVGRRQFVDRYPHLAGRAAAITNAIDTALWAAPVAGRAPLIAFAGRAAPEKGLAPLCEALDAVLEARPDWQAELALGDWDRHRSWSEAQLAPLARFGDRVTVRRDAPYDRVRALFQRAALVAIPSLWQEPFGLVAIEAHAAGSAVVSSGMGGLTEASGGHAVVVPPDADFPLRLAEALLALIDAPAEREALAAAGQAHAGEHHDAHDRARDLDETRRRIRDAGSGRS